jgi:hypothetical protein
VKPGDGFELNQCQISDMEQVDYGKLNRVSNLNVQGPGCFGPETKRLTPGARDHVLTDHRGFSPVPGCRFTGISCVAPILGPQRWVEH